MELEMDDPLCLHFNPRLELNGHALRTSHGCAVTYNPCLPDGTGIELEAKWVVEHYGLDTSYGWVICRDSFEPTVSGDTACVGMIGGADGPTAIAFGGSSQGKLCAACSALHFEPVQHDIAWRIIFHEKRYIDCSILLMNGSV
ncbi:MAG: hypothetical protein ACI4WY_09065 [Anaerovoracaceae bacterium]